MGGLHYAGTVSGIVEPSARRLPAGALLCVDPRSGGAGRHSSRRQLVAFFTAQFDPPVRRLPPRRGYLALELAYCHRRAYVDRSDDGPDLLPGDTNQRLGHVEVRMIVLWYALEEENPSRLRVPPTFILTRRPDGCSLPV